MFNGFDTIFKTVLMFFLGCLLLLLNKISTQIDKNADVGRYQFDNTKNYPCVIDTKTGTYKNYNGGQKINW
jgi:hypothetical protein